MTRPGVIALAVAVWSTAALATLPPPTPAEREAQEAKRAQEEAQLARQKAALERVQDAVADRYHRERPSTSPQPAGGVAERNMPYRARELPGSAGPHGGDKQSAEAHSAPAK